MIEVIAGAVLALVAVFAAYLKGKSTANKETRAKEAQDRAETLERVKNADIGNADGSGDLEWLRNRNK